MTAYYNKRREEMTNEERAQAVPDDLKIQCPLCQGKGIVSSTSFGHADKLVARSCHTCKGNGWIWALTLEEMAERIAKAEAEVIRLGGCLSDANAELMKMDGLREALKDLRIRFVGIFDGYVRKTYPEDPDDDSDLRLALADTDAAIAATEKHERP